MERKRFARLSQRLGALLLAGVTLWTVYATVGTSTPPERGWGREEGTNAPRWAPVAVRDMG